MILSLICATIAGVNIAIGLHLIGMDWTPAFNFGAVAYMFYLQMEIKK